MTKIIFLDIDGVLRTHKSDLDWSRELGVPIFRGTDRLFSKEAIDNLNEVIFLTKAKVVITSNWRLRLSLEQLRDKFKKCGFLGEIIDVTTVGFIDYRPLPIGDRGLEIRRWIYSNSCDRYVVIDDQVNDIIPILGDIKVVKVNPLNGFDDAVTDKVLDILL